MQDIQTLDRTPNGFEQKVIPTGYVDKLDPADNQIGVFITVELSSIRYRIDGGDPSASTGHLVGNGQSIYITDRQSLRNLRLIAIDSNALAMITYYI